MRKSILNIIKLIGINSGDSVFEVGCDSGAYLYAINEVLQITGGGVDYSRSLVDIAKKALPKMNFECSEAKNIASIPNYDHCISHSVFHYFDKSYAKQVLELMIDKAQKSVAILDIPNIEKNNLINFDEKIYLLMNIKRNIKILNMNTTIQIGF